MAITSASDLVAGLAAGQRYVSIAAAQSAGEGAAISQSLYDRAGTPGAGTLPATLAGTNMTNASTGAVALVDPAPSLLYLAGATLNATLAGQLTLFDLLWMNGGVTATTTTAQTVGTAAFPARDVNGSTNGEGLELWLSVHTTATTNGTAITNTTASYTNSLGTAAKTATIPSFPATAVAGTMVRFNLAGGDSGVRAVASLTLGTSYAAGTLNLMVVRRLADFAIPAPSQAFQFNYGDTGLPRVFPTSYLLWSFTPIAASPGAINSAFLTFAAK